MIRLPIIDRLPIVGPLVNDIVDGTTVIGARSTSPAPVPAGVEAKVGAATVYTAAVTFLMALLEPWLGKLPNPLRMVIKTILPPLVTAIAGYLAPHTARTAVPPKESSE